MAGKNSAEVILIIGDPHVGKTSSLGNFKRFNKLNIEKVSVFNFGGRRFKNSTFFGAYKMLDPLIYFVEIGGHVLDIVLEADKLTEKNEIVKAIRRVHNTMKGVSVIVYVLPLYEVYRDKAIERVLNHIKKIKEISSNSSNKEKYWILLFTYSEPYINSEIFIENPPNNKGEEYKKLEDIVSSKYKYTLDSIFSRTSPLIFEKYHKKIRESEKISDLEKILEELEKEDIKEYRRQWHIYRLMITGKVKGIEGLLERISECIKGILESNSIEDAEKIYNSAMTLLDAYRAVNLREYGNKEKWNENPKYKGYYILFREIYSQMEKVLGIFLELRKIKDKIRQSKGYMLQKDVAPEGIYISEDLAKRLENFVNNIRKIDGQYVVGVYIITNDVESGQLLKKKIRLDQICFQAMLKKIKELYGNKIIEKVKIREESPFISFFKKKIVIEDPEKLRKLIGLESEVERERSKVEKEIEVGKEFMREFPE